MKLEIRLTEIFEDNGWNIPVVEYVEMNKGNFNYKKEYKENISYGDAFADLICIDSSENVFWFDSGYEEYLEDQHDELREWLRSFFSPNDSDALLGFMRRQMYR